VSSRLERMLKRELLTHPQATTFFLSITFPNFLSREIRKRHTLTLPPSSVSLHPRLADRFIAGSVGDGWLRIHDFETGDEKETLKGHHGPAHAVSYSPDGELAASGSEDGEFDELRMTTTKGLSN